MRADRLSNTALIALAFLAILSVLSTAFAQSERSYTAFLCFGMETYVPLIEPDARDTVADCLSGTHIIEVDFSDKWKEGIGQVLFYSMWAEQLPIGPKRPGLILICRKTRDTCTDHIVRAFRVFEHYKIAGTIWDCDQGETSLERCQRIEAP
jgi:hypothetical protein